MLSISNSAIKKLRIETALTKPFPSILTFSSMHQDYNPKRKMNVFDGSYIEYKKSHQSQNSLKKLDHTCLIF